jgi:hypothetical protein
LIRRASSVVVPGRFPASMSACLTQPRNVSVVHPDPSTNPHDGCRHRQLRILLPSLLHKPHRPLPQVLRVLPRCWHNPDPLGESGRARNPRRFHLAPAARARRDEGNRRLHHRWVGFIERHKRQTVANVAIARELAGWCWSLTVRDT